MYPQVWNHGDWATGNDREFCHSWTLRCHFKPTGCAYRNCETHNSLNTRKDLKDGLVSLTNDKQDYLLLFVVAQAEINETEIRLSSGSNALRDTYLTLLFVPQIPYLWREKGRNSRWRLLMGIPQSDALSTDSLRNPDSIKWFVDYAKSNPLPKVGEHHLKSLLTPCLQIA